MVSDPKLNVTFSQLNKSFLSAPHLLTKSNNAGNAHNYCKLTNIWIRWKRCWFPPVHTISSCGVSLCQKTNTNSSTLWFLNVHTDRCRSNDDRLYAVAPSSQNSVIIKWRRKKTTLSFLIRNRIRTTYCWRRVIYQCSALITTNSPTYCWRSTYLIQSTFCKASETHVNRNQRPVLDRQTESEWNYCHFHINIFSMLHSKTFHS